MNNSAIADSFSLLAKLMDINGENSFKAKSYSSAAFAIEKLPVQLQEIPLNEIEKLKGIGTSSAKKIQELLKTGSLIQLEEIIFSTPSGVVEMLKIKGIGPKKIHTIWKEMQLESVGELLYACKENRLKLFKGFGEKTQQTVIENIEFYFRNKGSFLYAQLIYGAEQFLLFLQKKFPNKRILLTGECARQMEIITLLEFIIEDKIDDVENTLKTQQGLEFIERGTSFILYKTVIGVKVKLHAATENFIEKYIETSSSNNFLTKITDGFNITANAKTEEEYFHIRKLAFIPSFLREEEDVLTLNQPFTNHLQPNDIKGLIHCHSNWSDGNNTIEEMAKAAMQRGMEYMAISDHSKTAFYAQGLKEEQIKAQHQYIDELNIKLAPFKIFKSIESDILSDGNLDYSDNILSTFDLVIASVHSNLKMTEEKAMKRLLAAIENPYTTILGHLTGRLLLSRPSYPLNFKTIIDACAANSVVIELNANPNRLDIDWREIKYALQKNVLLSVNPDAHSLEGIDDVKYGVLSAQKAMLCKEKNLSSFSLAEFDTFVEARKKMKNI
ncbi:MAG: PHP domain-containing protein [Ferruginibacter sp.]|nr:PHP domain-containing protein [Ferruginibacter sp.]